jgi:hypothetical protein
VRALAVLAEREAEGEAHGGSTSSGTGAFGGRRAHAAERIGAQRP